MLKTIDVTFALAVLFRVSMCVMYVGTYAQRIKFLAAFSLCPFFQKKFTIHSTVQHKKYVFRHHISFFVRLFQVKSIQIFLLHILLTQIVPEFY